jgi:hypothetical protein
MKRLKVAIALFSLLAFGISFAQEKIEMGKQNVSEVDKLISIVKDEQNMEKAPVLFADAIIKLGQLRAVEAIPLLIKNIAFLDPREEPPIWPYSIVTRRVAVKALVAIGKPSVEPILKAVRQEDTRLRLILMSGVIYGVEGPLGGADRVAEEEKKVEAEKERLARAKAFVKEPPIM